MSQRLCQQQRVAEFVFDALFERVMRGRSGPFYARRPRLGKCQVAHIDHGAPCADADTAAPLSWVPRSYHLNPRCVPQPMARVATWLGWRSFS